MRGPAFFAYSDNYLIDVKSGIIMDVEASRAIRQAEVSAARTMIERTEQCFAIKPERLAGDTAYGSGANLNWLVSEAKIAPHIPVVDKSKREDGTFSREDFIFDKERNVYICPAGKVLTTTGKVATGCAKLDTRPIPIGSLTTAITTGTSVVACLAAIDAVALSATITSTGNRANSAALLRRRSGSPCAERNSITYVCPST